MATPVVLTTGARPIVPVESGGVPMTPVDTLGEPVTVVNTLGEPVVLINNDGTPAFLAYSAKTYLGGVAPYHWLDFINNRALYAGADVGNVTQATGYSFTRASTGYYQNADGTLEWFESGQPRMKRDAPNGHNIFLHSEALTTANNWTTPFVSNATRTDGALSVTTDEGFVYFARTSSILSGATYTVSADVVCDQTISNVPLRISSSTATSLLVNFVAGVTQRITFAAITGSGDGSVQIGLDARDAIVPGGSNATGYTVTFNKVQLNEGSSATAYVATTTTPVYAPRRGDRGVLIEGARTNLLVRSQEFDNASWTKENTTISANATTAPDGTTTADQFVETTGTGGHVANQQATVSNATNYTITAYFKKGPTSRDFAVIGTVGAGTGYSYFNLTTGAVCSKLAQHVSHSMTALANGWYRCQVVVLTTTTTLATYVGAAPTDGGASYTGDTAYSQYVWQADTQLGAFPSSPIVTVAASATRASDVLSYTVNTTAQIQAAVAGQPEATKGAWTQVTATATISGEDVSLSGGAGFPAAGRSITGLTVGNWYAASVNVTAVSGNQSFEYRNSATPGGGSRVVAQPFNTTGVKVLLFRAEAGNNIEVRGDGGTPTVSFTSLSVKEVPAGTAAIYPLTLWAEFERAVPAGTAANILLLDNGGGNEVAEMTVNASGVPNVVTVSGGVVVSSITVGTAMATGDSAKVAFRVSTNSVQMARAGTLGTEDTSNTNPLTPTRFRIGINSGTGANAFSYIRRAAVFTTALTDAQLQTTTGS